MCSVSLLVKYEKAQHALDWEVMAPLSPPLCSLPALPPPRLFSSATLTAVVSRGVSQVGLHGIFISFEDSRGKQYSATYLPEVASEQGWTQIETLRSLVKKAGYDAKGLTEEQLRGIETTRYQSSKCSLNYEEYVAARA